MLRQIEPDLEDDNEPSEGPCRRLSRAEHTILCSLPPIPGGDFQGIRGLSSDGEKASSARRSFLALPAIGSMSPTRLSRSMVASLQSRFCFTWWKHFIPARPPTGGVDSD